jgi:hypothetical protein
MTLMTTKAQRRARATAKSIFDSELHARIDRERNTPSDEQKRQALMRSCIAESAAESAAQQHAAFAPVREVEKTLNADRERAARNARYNLSLPNCAYLAEICPPFSKYTGREEDYLDSVRNTFINEFQTRLESTGVNLTQAGLESLAELSDNNTSHQPAPVKPDPRGDFDTLLATRPADDPELRNAAHEFAIAEAQPTFQAWTESLMNSFGYAMSLPIAKQVSDWFIRMNRSFLDRSAYDECRRAFVREGLMPRTCLTADDLAAEEMESLDIRTPEGRRRAAQLHREGIRRNESAVNQSFQS